MSNLNKVGKVLWWCLKNENGIITDAEGREFYFDRSVLSLLKKQKIERGSLVLFEPTTVDAILAARNVSVPEARKRKRYEQLFDQDKNQLKLPLDLGISCQVS